MLIDLMGTRVLMAPEGEPAGSTDGTETVAEPEDAKQSAGESKAAVGGEKDGSAPGVPAWMAQLPNDLKTNLDIAKYKTLGEYVKAMQDGKKEEAKETTEAKSEPVKYTNFAKKFDAEDDPFGDMSSFTVSELEKLGIPQDKAEAFFEEYSNASKNAKGRLLKEGAAWCAAQKANEWGDNFDQKKNQMLKASTAYIDKDLEAKLQATGALVNPAVWELLSRVGGSIAEDHPVFMAESGTAKKAVDPLAPIDYSKPSA